MKSARIGILCIALVALSMSVGNAQEQSWNFNFKGGLLLPGTVNVDPPGYDYDSNIGWLATACIDAMVAPKLSFGGFVLLGGPSITAGGTDYGATVTTLGATIKGRFAMSNGMQLRPGLAIGYQMINTDAVDEGTKGLDAGLMLEVAKPLTGSKNALVGEIGFITQPSGGNEDSDVTFGPIFYLLFGYEFGG